MKQDRFFLGVFAVDPSEGDDRFDSTRFPNMKVVTKEKAVKKMNRLFRSQTAFLADAEELPSFSAEEEDVSVKKFLPSSLTA